MALVSQLTIRAAKFEGQLQQVDKELEATKLQLATEREARLAAEVGAARMSGQLEAIYRQSWYQFWRPKKPGE